MASSEESQVIACHHVDEWTKHFNDALQSKKLVVVDFTASWCGPCRFIAPLFAEFSNKFTHVIILKVDVDELKSVAKEYEVQAMPTFLFIKEGKVVDKIVGADKVELKNKITTLGAITA